METPSNQQQKNPGSNIRTKTTIAETYYANCKLVPIPGLNGKYKLDLTKIKEQELVILPPEENDNRLFGWKVEVRQRSNGKNYDKFYSHMQNDARFRSTPEVIDYILHGKQKKENAKKSGRAPKRNNRSEEDEANTDSHPAENEKDESLSTGGSPREVPQLQLQLNNEAVENEFSSLMRSLKDGNNGKGISIHDQEPAGGLNLQSKVSSSSGNLKVEGKGKGILIEEKRSVFGIHTGIMFSPQPYTCANNFQIPTIMQGWSMEGNGRMFMGGSWNNSMNMGMNGSSNSSLQSNPIVLANLHDPCKATAMQSIQSNGQPLSANMDMDIDSGSFDVMPSEAEMEELMSFIYSDLEEEKEEEEVEKEKEEEVDAVQDNETDLTEIYNDIIDDQPIVDSFYDKYWRNKLP